MLRHAVWLLNRFQLHARDNKTSFQRRWSTAYHNSVLPFGELVLAQDQKLAIWLGRCEASDEHILAKANSCSLVKGRTVTRLSLESSMDPILFKSISLPQPEPASAAYLKMARRGDQAIAKAGAERELRMVSPPQASNHLQSKAKGRQPRAFYSSQACPYGLSDLAWQQPPLHQSYELQPTALHLPVVQQPASATTVLIEQVLEPTLRRQPSEEQASQPQPVRSEKPKGSEEITNKLQNILEKARTFQEIELAVTTSEEESRESQAAVKAAQLQAYFEGDLSLFSAEEIKKAKQKEGESLRGTYESVPRTSFTAYQLSASDPDNLVSARTVFIRGQLQLESQNSRYKLQAADL